VETGFRKRSCSSKKHDPEKWKPVFGKRSCSSKKHDPEKWEPVSRLREALSNHLHFGLMLRRAKPGQKKIMLNKKARTTIQRNLMAL
jgi:hypothetical protein